MADNSKLKIQNSKMNTHGFGPQYAAYWAAICWVLGRNMQGFAKCSARHPFSVTAKGVKNRKLSVYG